MKCIFPVEIQNYLNRQYWEKQLLHNKKYFISSPIEILRYFIILTDDFTFLPRFSLFYRNCKYLWAKHYTFSFI